ncbi:MAG: hypothetical protein ACODAU_03025 [Myxococcota bacterium]
MAGRRIALAVVLACTVAGGAARMGTAGWGLPYQLHVDEKGFVVWEAVYAEWRGLMRGDWRPRINTYGPLVFELVLATKWATMGGIERAREVAAQFQDPAGYLRGAFGHLGDAPFHWPDLYLRLRLLVGLLGAVAVALLAAAAWRLEGPRAGAWTAAMAASAVGLIQVGHFYTAESLLVVELCMLLHACARLATGGGWGSAVYAGVATGLIAATKVPGLLLLAAVPVALAAPAPSASAARWRDAAREAGRATLRALVSGRFLAVVGVGLAVAALFNPWALFEPQAYFGEVAGNRSGLGVLRTHFTETEFGFYDWRFVYNDTTPFVYHLRRVLPYAIGTPLLLASGVALVSGARRLRPVDRLALAATLPTLLLIGAWGVKTIRYALPMVPGLLLAAGPALARWSVPEGTGAVRRLGVPLIAWGTAAYTVAYGLAFTLMFTEPDPRVAAARFITERAQPGDVVVVEAEPSYTAPLGHDHDLVGVAPDLRPDVRVRRLWTTRPPPERVDAHVQRRLRAARFVVIGDWYRRRAEHPRAPAPHRRFYEALRGGDMAFERVATFRPEPHLGPLRWSEDDAEILAVSFDHMGIEVYERTEATGP